MDVYSPIRKIFLEESKMAVFKKEKEVIRLILSYLDEVEECVLEALKGIELYLKGDVNKAKALARETRSLETRADLIRYEIRDKLYSGAYLPLLREDIYKLVESIDKVANAGEACSNFFLNQRPIIPESLNPQFLAAVQESIIEPLKEAVICFLEGECPVETVREFAKDVGNRESEVDKIEWDLTKAIFVSSLDHGQKMHLKLWPLWKSRTGQRMRPINWSWSP
jgi:predicted phosphate transport protein (TIGR00153 family)